MYKTVRQGENSLQYTILPQTEEVLTNSGVKGKGRDYSPSSHVRRISRKLMIYYMAIVFFGLLLTFGTLLFTLVLCGIVPIDLPTHLKSVKHEQLVAKATVPCSTVQPDKSPTRKKELAHDMKLLQETSTHKTFNLASNKTTIKSEENTTVTYLEKLLTATQPTTVASSPLPPTEQVFIIPAIKKQLISSTSSSSTSTEPIKLNVAKTTAKFSPPFIRQRESNADLMLGHDTINYTDFGIDEDEDYDLTRAPTTDSAASDATKRIPARDQIKTMTVSDNQKSLSTTPVSGVESTKIVQNNLAANKNKTYLYSVKYKEMKERLLDDDDEEYKEPLTDEDDVDHTGSDDVKMSHAKSSWIQTRWPFVDPSSYFQWTGYSARDNLLLPAILSAAIAALLVLAILCYVLRRRQRCKRRIQEIGNLTSDLQAEDNAILLTAENPSEED